MGKKPQIHSYKICRYVYTKDAKFVHIDLVQLLGNCKIDSSKHMLVYVCLLTNGFLPWQISIIFGLGQTSAHAIMGIAQGLT